MKYQATFRMDLFPFEGGAKKFIDNLNLANWSKVEKIIEEQFAYNDDLPSEIAINDFVEHDQETIFAKLKKMQ